MKGTKLLEAKIQAEQQQKVMSLMPNEATAAAEAEAEAEDAKVCGIPQHYYYPLYYKYLCFS